jgi:DNA-binding XRE family transcriptional regulator
MSDVGHMVIKAKRIRRTFSSAERRKYRDTHARVDAERDEIIAEARRRKQAYDAVAAELRHAFRLLKKERQAQGLSLADMQDRTGMSRSAISRLENDDSANPTIETLTRYAEALGKQLAITLTDKAS